MTNDIEVLADWEPLPDPDAGLPTIEEMGGSDPAFTGELTTEEHLRLMRGGETVLTHADVAWLLETVFEYATAVKNLSAVDPTSTPYRKAMRDLERFDVILDKHRRQGSFGYDAE